MQLQGMQAIVFLLVATGNYLDTGVWSTFMFQVLVQLPSIGACLKVLGKGSGHCRASKRDSLACPVPACRCRPGGTM